jgi:hypothetical protein
MTSEEKAQLRLMLGEVIPPGGSDSDTLFFDGDIENIFSDAGADFTTAGMIGWRLKAGKLADLVDITEVGEQVKLSQLHGQALKMVEIYEDLAGYPRAKIHRLSRDTPREHNQWW